MGQPKGSRIGDSNASFSCLADVRYVDMMRVDLNAQEIGSVLLLERNCEIQGGIESRVCFSWCEEMQVLFGSESSEGDRQAPRCAILVCESESGRNVQRVDGSVRNERHEPRCVLPWMQRGYRGVCTTKDVDCSWSRLELEPIGVFELPVEIVPHNARTTGKNCNSGLLSSLSELEQIEDMTATIAKSEYTECLKRARLAERAPLKVSRRW